jgi:hypothetical protein
MDVFQYNVQILNVGYLQFLTYSFHVVYICSFVGQNKRRCSNGLYDYHEIMYKGIHGLN